MPVNYVRSLVFRNDHFEVRLLCWRPGHASSLHAHGRSSCAFRIVRGALTEIMLGGRDRKYPPGTVIEENDAGRVHQAMNCESDPLITLHVYSPPIPIDKPSERHGDEHVIVGGGLSGAAIAYHLLKNGDRSLRVSMIERGPNIGRGIAYGVESKIFLLNVPASRMSIDPELPSDFVEFAGSQADPHAFLPRAVYGAYVADRLAKMISQRPGKLRVYRDEAVGVRQFEGGGEVELRSGEVRRGRSVVIATGLSPRMMTVQPDPRVIDAWDECALGALPHDGRILVLGSGLSALDAIAWFEHLRFRGDVRIVSPRALFPLAHRERMGGHSAGYSAELIASLPTRLAGRFQWVLRQIAEAESSGQGFQSVADGLRPHIEHLYRTLSSKDRQRFIRHVRPYWEILRHRAPRESLARLDRWRSAGRLELTAGRMVRDERSGDRIVATIRRRDGTTFDDTVDRIVRCVGPALALEDSATPLTRSLIDNQLAVRDESGLGLATDRDGRFILPTGASSSFLFGLGAVRRASSWETTSVPDISIQARDVAKRCLG